jgi:hypothetical protein
MVNPERNSRYTSAHPGTQRGELQDHLLGLLGQLWGYRLFTIDRKVRMGGRL